MEVAICLKSPGSDSAKHRAFHWFSSFGFINLITEAVAVALLLKARPRTATNLQVLLLCAIKTTTMMTMRCQEFIHIRWLLVHHGGVGIEKENYEFKEISSPWRFNDFSANFFGSPINRKPSPPRPLLSL